MQTRSRRNFFKRISFGFLSVPFFDASLFAGWIKRDILKLGKDRKVYFTTGFKVMEVQTNSALVWTRLCGQELPNTIRHERREKVFRHPIDFDESMPVEEMDGAVKGSSGMVRMKLLYGGEERITDWMQVSEDNDFTVKYFFDGLHEDVLYAVEIEGKFSLLSPSQIAKGTFRTLPGESGSKPVTLVTSTCQYFWSYDDKDRGFKTYDSMRKLNPDFFIHTGDYIYYDKPGPFATTAEKARHKWHAMDSWPSIKDLYKEVPVYKIKDDHDLLKDDAFPGISPYGQLSFEQGLKIWYENVPLQDKPYRTFRWGSDLQIWMVEGREFRPANTVEDGERKSIWGEKQKKWFMDTLEASDATFKLLFTATPVVGPDRETKKDNHANKVFQTALLSGENTK